MRNGVGASAPTFLLWKDENMKSRIHGSPKETGQVHGGKVKGAGELGGNHGSPGKAAMRVTPKPAGGKFEGGKKGGC